MSSHGSTSPGCGTGVDSLTRACSSGAALEGYYRTGGSEIVDFWGLGGRNRTQDPLRSTGPAPYINLHKKSAPETNSNAISLVFFTGSRENIHDHRPGRGPFKGPSGSFTRTPGDPQKDPTGSSFLKIVKRRKDHKDSPKVAKIIKNRQKSPRS